MTTKTNKPYRVEFFYAVYVWAEDEDAAYDLARTYGADEAGFGENFDKLDTLEDCVEVVEDEFVWPVMFINPQDDPEFEDLA